MKKTLAFRIRRGLRVAPLICLVFSASLASAEGDPVALFSQHELELLWLSVGDQATGKSSEHSGLHSPQEGHHASSLGSVNLTPASVGLAPKAAGASSSWLTALRTGLRPFVSGEPWNYAPYDAATGEIKADRELPNTAQDGWLFYLPFHIANRPGVSSASTGPDFISTSEPDAWSVMRSQSLTDSRFYVGLGSEALANPIVHAAGVFASDVTAVSDAVAYQLVTGLLQRTVRREGTLSWHHPDIDAFDAGKPNDLFTGLPGESTGIYPRAAGNRKVGLTLFQSGPAISSLSHEGQSNDWRLLRWFVRSSVGNLGRAAFDQEGAGGNVRIQRMIGQDAQAHIDNKILPANSDVARVPGAYKQDVFKAEGLRVWPVSFMGGGMVNIGVLRLLYATLDLGPSSGGLIHSHTGVRAETESHPLVPIRNAISLRLLGPQGEVLADDAWESNLRHDSHRFPSVIVNDDIVLGDGYSDAGKTGYSTDVVHLDGVLRIPAFRDTPDLHHVAPADRVGVIAFVLGTGEEQPGLYVSTLGTGDRELVWRRIETYPPLVASVSYPESLIPFERLQADAALQGRDLLEIRVANPIPAAQPGSGVEVHVSARTKEFATKTTQREVELFNLMITPASNSVSVKTQSDGSAVWHIVLPPDEFSIKSMNENTLAGDRALTYHVIETGTGRVATGVLPF